MNLLKSSNSFVVCDNFGSRGLCFLRNRLRFGRQGHWDHLWFNNGLLSFATPSISQVKGKQIWHPIIQMVLKSREEATELPKGWKFITNVNLQKGKISRVGF